MGDTPAEPEQTGKSEPRRVEGLGREVGSQPRPDGVYVSSTAIALLSLAIALATSFAWYLTSRFDGLAEMTSRNSREVRGYIVDHVQSSHEDASRDGDDASMRILASTDEGSEATAASETPTDLAKRLVLAPVVSVGSISAELTAEQPIATFALDVERGHYRINASPGDTNVDPVLRLYRAWHGVIAEIAEGDDIGEEDRTARIDARIEDTGYFFDVREFDGRTGMIELEIQRLAEAELR